jgi:hypothetical protein
MVRVEGFSVRKSASTLALEVGEQRAEVQMDVLVR